MPRERARQCLRVDSLTKEEYASYFHHMDNLVYARSALEFAFERGMEEGMKQGIEECIKQGKEEGRSETLRTVVQSLIANGMTPPVIARTLHLKQEEVDHLLEE